MRSCDRRAVHEHTCWNTGTANRAPGSVVMHDMKRSHPSLAKAVKYADAAYKANATDLAYLEAMKLVNNLCSWLRRRLFRFPGMKKSKAVL